MQKSALKTYGGISTTPGNLASSFIVNENKAELFVVLSDILCNSLQLADEELVITEGYVLRKSPHLDTSALALCNHEAACSLMILHTAYATLSEKKSSK